MIVCQWITIIAVFQWDDFWQVFPHQIISDEIHKLRISASVFYLQYFIKIREIL